MKITIGGLDYTSALDAAWPLAIERKLNQPTICRVWITLGTNDELAAPTQNQPIAIIGDDGTSYFTGYTTTRPVPQYIGDGLEGPKYRLEVTALSEEWLLDQLPMPTSAGIAGEMAGTIIGGLISHSGSTNLKLEDLSANLGVVNIIPNHGASWSKTARRVADMARMSYRILNGALTLVPIQSIVHPLYEDDGSLNPANLVLTSGIDRLPTNDVTLCGNSEPVAYVTEYFRGDGVTSMFYLAADAYKGPAKGSTIIRELFDEPAIDLREWACTGGPGYFSLGTGGLVMRGGAGIDGQTALSWRDPVEMGGTLLLEATGVTIANGSTGIIAGFFDGGTDLSSCTVGFQAAAQQGSGNVTLQPLIFGAIAGTAFAVKPSNQYTLRLRVHSPECYRATAIYRGSDDGGSVTAGGAWNMSPGKIQIELQEFVNGVGGMPVTLYDGTINGLPGSCTLMAASSVNLLGSMRAIHLTNLGSGWVVSTPPNGGAYTRRLGSPAEAGECQFQSGGKLQFQTGFIPIVGELVAVSYRTVGRAVGRSVNADNQQKLVEAGLPAVASARCSADCRNAAVVTAQTAADDSGRLRGTYQGNNFEFADDVWPGDALLVNAPSAGLNSQVVVRDVKVSYSASLPDLFEYEITFANDWAEDLAIKRSSNVPEDVWLPAPVAPTVLPNLSGLTVTTLNGSIVEINTGAVPPVGGGFEVRRRDFEFMPGTDPGLVTRSALPNIIFSRETNNDRFFVRMYDGETPPNYSEFSTALFINLPLGL